jgi:hypothetical protein
MSPKCTSQGNIMKEVNVYYRLNFSEKGFHFIKIWYKVHETLYFRFCVCLALYIYKQQVEKHLNCIFIYHRQRIINCTTETYTSAVSLCSVSSGIYKDPATVSKCLVSHTFYHC